MNVRTSWLDFKLSLRMMRKYPFVTVVAVLATSFAIGAGALYFEVVSDVVSPALPLEDGDRVVEVHNEDPASTSTESRSLHDYAVWRRELKSVQDLGVYTTQTLNFGLAGADAQQPEEVVEISASAFRVARIRPLQGRPLVAADEEEGAPQVVVIGERIWESRFNRDPAIVGRSLQIGPAAYTVVGVMPAAFALPVNQGIWVPFRTNPLTVARRQGPSIGTIGRLAPGATLEEAQAEVTVLGNRIEAESPSGGGEARLRPQVVPYLDRFTPDTAEGSVRLGLNVIFMMLLAVICANVGALVFARIVTREKEFSVRTALGASRGRIVMQLFVEALLLTILSGIVALMVVSWGVRKGQEFLNATHGITPPFWQDSTLNPGTVLYVAVLAVVGAVAMGVLPALKFTRGSVEASLRRSGTGSSGMRSRRMSTAVIVVQVALASALLPIAMTGALGLNWSKPEYPGIRPAEFLTVRYGIEDAAEAAPDGGAARAEAMQQEIKRRVLAEPGFAGATFAQQLPGSTHFRHSIEVSPEGGGASEGLQNARVAYVDADFFQTFKTPILAGRGFRAGDAAAQNAVVVNQPFVRTVLGGRNAVGRRVRFPSPDGKETGPWYEIVGVVPDLGMNPLKPDRGAGLYRLAAPGTMQYGFLAIRVEGSTEEAAQKFRTIASQANKSFLIYDVRPLDRLVDSELQMDRAFALLVIGGSFFLVLLSAAVTFALMSFTVSQRTREIGIYKALGATPRAVLTSVFSRAFVQLGIGAGLGAVGSVFIFSRAPGSSVDPLTMLAVLGVMLLVGIVSCGAPALRALRTEPIIAMKEDV